MKNPEDTTTDSVEEAILQRATQKLDNVDGKVIRQASFWANDLTNEERENFLKQLLMLKLKEKFLKFPGRSADVADEDSNAAGR